MGEDWRRGLLRRYPYRRLPEGQSAPLYSRPLRASAQQREGTGQFINSSYTPSLSSIFKYSPLNPLIYS